jgi:hypothetical protein
MLLPFPKRSSETIELHGVRWSADHVLPLVDELQQFHWEKRPWIARDTLVHRSTGQVAFFSTQPFDRAAFHLVHGGWTCDRCLICRWELFESPDDPQHGMGYTNGRDWLCLECGEKFVAPLAGADQPFDYT